MNNKHRGVFYDIRRMRYKLLNIYHQKFKHVYIILKKNLSHIKRRRMITFLYGLLYTLYGRYLASKMVPDKALFYHLFFLRVTSVRYCLV